MVPVLECLLKSLAFYTQFLLSFKLASFPKRLVTLTTETVLYIIVRNPGNIIVYMNMNVKYIAYNVYNRKESIKENKVVTNLLYLRR